MIGSHHHKQQRGTSVWKRKEKDMHILATVYIVLILTNILKTIQDASQ